MNPQLANKLVQLEQPFTSFKRKERVWWLHQVQPQE